jgi:hypothetical protein
MGFMLVVIVSLELALVLIASKMELQVEGEEMKAVQALTSVK